MAIGFSFTGLVKYVTDIVKGLVNFDRVPLAPKESNAMLVHNEITYSQGEQEYRVIGGISSDWYKENIEFGHGRGKSTNSHGFILKQNGTVVMKADKGGIFEGTSTRVYSPNNKPTPADLSAADVVHSHSQLNGSNYIQGGTQSPSYFGSGKLRYQMLSVGGMGWADTLWISSYSGGDVPVSNQIVMDKSGNGNIGFRQQRFDSGTWGRTYAIYHNGKDTGWQPIERLNSKFVSSGYHGFDHRWRIDNGTLYILLRGIFRTTVNGEGLGYIPNWRYGVVFLPTIGYGDRGGAREGKSLAISANGMIHLNTAGDGEFSVYTGVVPVKL